MKRSFFRMLFRKIKRIIFNSIRSKSKMVVPLGDYLSDELILFDSWEEELKWIISENINNKDRSVLIDIGANIGATTVMLQDYFNFFILFEPIPSLYHIAKWNTRKINNCKVYNKGISEKTGKAEIYIPEKNTGSSSLYMPKSKQAESIIIDLVDGSFIKNELNKILPDIDEIVIKIDTEGIDHVVLKQISWIFNLKINFVIIIEVSSELTESIIHNILPNFIIPKKLERRINGSFFEKLLTVFIGDEFKLEKINSKTQSKFPYEMVIKR